MDKGQKTKHEGSETSKLPIILFGGSFDPIHNGHLLIANYVKQFTEKVVFIPCSENPLNKKPQVTGKHRLEMIKLATKIDEKYDVSDIELKREGKSYTIDTINYFIERGLSDLGLLVGYDAILDIKKWQNSTEILKKVKLFIFPRPGINPKLITEFLKEPIFKKTNIQLIEEKSLNISSTQVKIYAYLKEDINQFVPQTVAEYIEKKKLYTG